MLAQFSCSEFCEVPGCLAFGQCQTTTVVKAGFPQKGLKKMQQQNILLSVTGSGSQEGAKLQHFYFVPSCQSCKLRDYKQASLTNKTEQKLPRAKFPPCEAQLWGCVWLCPKLSLCNLIVWRCAEIKPAVSCFDGLFTVKDKCSLSLSCIAFIGQKGVINLHWLFLSLYLIDETVAACQGVDLLEGHCSSDDI